jgi:hypothetical protein
LTCDDCDRLRAVLEQAPALARGLYLLRHPRDLEGADSLRDILAETLERDAALSPMKPQAGEAKREECRHVAPDIDGGVVSGVHMDSAGGFACVSCGARFAPVAKCRVPLPRAGCLDCGATFASTSELKTHACPTRATPPEKAKEGEPNE